MGSEQRQRTEKPEVTDEHKDKAKEMAKAYDETRPTTTLAPAAAGRSPERPSPIGSMTRTKARPKPPPRKARSNTRKTEEFCRKTQE